MDLAGFSTKGPRSINEDCYYFLDFSEVGLLSSGVSAFMMVSDGMGGHDGGDIASRIAAQEADNYLRNLLKLAETSEVDLDVPFILTEIVNNAHKAITQEIDIRGNISMGATFVGAFLSPQKAWIAHVGDSRAYLVNQRECKQLTRDHSAVGRFLSMGLLTEEEAQHHPQRNVIDQALGMMTDKPEITEVSLMNGDALLLCSDGIYTVLSAKMLGDCVLSANSADMAVNSLIDLALKEDTDDNATAVIAIQNWSTLKPAAVKADLMESAIGSSQRSRMRPSKDSSPSHLLNAFSFQFKSNTSDSDPEFLEEHLDSLPLIVLAFACVIIAVNTLIIWPI